MSDFIAGASVGLAQVAVGHPFDTAKVLIQNKTPLSGLSISNFYRGWRFPLFSASLFNCTVFPIYERTYKYTNNSLLSGALSGVAVTPTVFMFDIGKIRQQTAQSLKIKDFLNTKGFYSTGLREVSAMSFYFGSYFYFKDDFNLDPFFAGGLAGLVNWTGTYPIDVIRNRQIAQNISFKKALSQKKLWSGYPVCAFRSVLVNSVNFKVYETVKAYIDSKVQA